jgi:hypothetical protein
MAKYQVHHIFYFYYLDLYYVSENWSVIYYKIFIYQAFSSEPKLASSSEPEDLDILNITYSSNAILQFIISFGR